MGKENIDIMKASAAKLGVTIPDNVKEFQVKDMLVEAIRKEYGETEYDCGDCKNFVPLEFEESCPFCGAKFEGEEEEEEEDDSPVTGKAGGESKAQKELNKLDKDLADIDGGTGKSVTKKKTSPKKEVNTSSKSASKSKKETEEGKDKTKSKKTSKKDSGDSKDKKKKTSSKSKKKTSTKKKRNSPNEKLNSKDPYEWYDGVEKSYSKRIDQISELMTEKYGDAFENPYIMRNYIGFWVGDERIIAVERSGRILLNNLPNDAKLPKKLNTVVRYLGKDERKANRYGKVGIFINKKATSNQVTDALKSYFRQLPFIGKDD